jgi:hypothetical protein
LGLFETSAAESLPVPYVYGGVDNSEDEAAEQANVYLRAVDRAPGEAHPPDAPTCAPCALASSCVAGA